MNKLQSMQMPQPAGNLPQRLLGVEIDPDVSPLFLIGVLDDVR
jgi:hypothetical protein